MTALFRPRFPLPLPSSSTSLSGRTIANLSPISTSVVPNRKSASRWKRRPIFPNNKFFFQTNANSPLRLFFTLSNRNLFYFPILFPFSKYIYFFYQYFEIEKFFFWMSNRIFSFSKCICTLLYDISRYRIINAFDSRKKASRALRWVRSILLRLSHDSTSLYGHRINCRLTLFNNHTFAPSFPRLVSNYSYRALQPIVLFTFQRK